MSDLSSNRKVSINTDAIMSLINSAPNNPVLSKYDKDHNSIFSQEEVMEFLNDVKQFASKDSDKENLSEKEAIKLYNFIMSHNDKNFKKVKEFKNETNPVIEFLRNLNKNFDIKKTLSEKFDMVNPETIDEYQLLTEEEFENAKKIMNADITKRLNPDSIYILAKCHSDSTEKIIYVINLLNKLGENKRDLNLIGIELLVQKDIQDIDRIPRLINIEGRRTPMPFLEISKALNLSEEDLEAIIQKDPNFYAVDYEGNYTKISSSSNENEDLIYDNVTHKQAGKITYQETDEYYIKTEEDFNSHTKRVRYESRKNPLDVKIYEYHYDENNNLLSTTEYVDGTGGLDLCVSSTDKNGKKTPIQWASIDQATGERTIQKNIISPDGTKTEYNYEQTTDGICVSEYKITDKDGNVLLNQTRTFEKKDENHFISSLNEKIYETEFSGYKIIIHDKSSDEVHTLDLTGKIEPENFSAIMSVLKRMPADMLLKMENRRLDKFEDDWDPSWNPDEYILTMRSSESEDDIYEPLGILMHEFGHFIDTASDDGNGILSGNEEFIKIYREEYANLVKTAPFSDRHILEYFTTHTGELGGRLETLAECNLLLTNEYTSQRAFYLQKYFPRTIAKAAELLNNA